MKVVVNNLVFKYVEDDIVATLKMDSVVLESTNRVWEPQFVVLKILFNHIRICALPALIQALPLSTPTQDFEGPWRLLRKVCSVENARMYLESLSSRYRSQSGI